MIGRFSLRGLVLNREPIPLWRHFAIIPMLFIWLGLAFTQLGAVDDFLARAVFPWVPVWATPAALVVDVTRYSQTALLWAAVLGLLLNGILGYAVEELYFYLGMFTHILGNTIGTVALLAAILQ